MTSEFGIKLKDGRTLGYSEFGNAQGKPLLYFHGGVSSRLDIAFADKFCQFNNIRIIAPDRPGIGISDRQPDRTLLDWADDTEQLLNHLEIERLPLLGWSLAGAYVCACLYKHPQRFSLAATVGGASPILPPVKVKEMGLALDQWLLTCPKSLEWALALFIEASARLPGSVVRGLMLNELRGPDKEIVAEMSEADAIAFIIEATRQGGMGIIDDYRAMSHDWGFQLSDVSHPLTLWFGEEDNICPVSMPKYVQQHMPYTTLHMVPGLGHFLLHRKLKEIFSDLKLLED